MRPIIRRRKREREKERDSENKERRLYTCPVAPLQPLATARSEGGKRAPTKGEREADRRQKKKTQRKKKKPTHTHNNNGGLIKRGRRISLMKLIRGCQLRKRRNIRSFLVLSICPHFILFFSFSVFSVICLYLTYFSANVSCLPPPFLLLLLLVFIFFFFIRRIGSERSRLNNSAFANTRSMPLWGFYYSNLLRGLLGLLPLSLGLFSFASLLFWPLFTFPLSTLFPPSFSSSLFPSCHRVPFPSRSPQDGGVVVVVVSSLRIRFLLAVISF